MFLDAAEQGSDLPRPFFTVTKDHARILSHRDDSLMVQDTPSLSPREPVHELATGLLYLMKNLDGSDRELWTDAPLPGLDRIIERLIDDERHPAAPPAGPAPKSA